MLRNKDLHIWNVFIQGQDFCSTSGYEALVKKNKDGRQMLKDYVKFLQDRWLLSLNTLVGVLKS